MFLWLIALWEKKYPVLLQLCYCYAFEPNGAYLWKGWRSYWLWISRALVHIWLLWSTGQTHTQQAQLLDRDSAEWLSLCLLCLNYLSGTTAFFSFISLICPIWKTNSRPLSMQKIIQSCIGNKKNHAKIWINLVSEISVRIIECLSHLFFRICLKD